MRKTKNRQILGRYVFELVGANVGAVYPSVLSGGVELIEYMLWVERVKPTGSWFFFLGRGLYGWLFRRPN